MKRILTICNIIVFALLSLSCNAQIIDMHLHAYLDPTFSIPVKDYYGNGGSANAELHFKESYQYLRQYHVVKAVVSGSIESVDSWIAKDVDNRLIRGFGMDSPNDYGMDSTKFEKLVKAGKIKIFGEIGAYYSGTTGQTH